MQKQHIVTAIHVHKMNFGLQVDFGSWDRIIGVTAVFKNPPINKVDVEAVVDTGTVIDQKISVSWSTDFVEVTSPFLNFEFRNGIWLPKTSMLGWRLEVQEFLTDEVSQDKLWEIIKDWERFNQSLE